MHLERVLFLVAPQDSGKSTVMRSMFLDRRFGMQGEPPSSKEQKRLGETHWLGNERRLYVRLTSPHEYGETLTQFIRKCRSKMQDGRWCLASPLQPEAFRKMPDVVETVRAFNAALQPERCRVLFISPNRHGVEVTDFASNRDLRDELLSKLGVEVACIDGRRRDVNGLLLADFFDFT